MKTNFQRIYKTFAMKFSNVFLAIIFVNHALSILKTKSLGSETRGCELRSESYSLRESFRNSCTPVKREQQFKKYKIIQNYKSKNSNSS
jgi:hypothetical protein